MLIDVVCFFFFSSRRRHTRYIGDWSSDVCSSDLPIQVVSEDQLRVEGGVALSELEAVLGHSFDREDVSTVGGLVLAEFGRVPRAGETIDLDGYRLVVEQVIRRRVRRVAVYRPAIEAGLGGAERVLP